MQIWKSLGLVFGLKKINLSWMKSHAMLPVVLKLKKNQVRIFFGTRNQKNISSVGYVDLKYKQEKFKVVNFSKNPDLEPGSLVCFDDNGVVPSCIIKKN